MKDKVDKIVFYFDKHKKQARTLVFSLAVSLVIVATGIAISFVLLSIMAASGCLQKITNLL